MGTSKQIRSGAAIGVLTGLVAWSCCVSAVVLGFLGLSVAAAFMANVQMMYHWWLVALAFIFMDGAIYYFLKHYNGTCDIKVIRHNWAQVLFIVLVAVLAYLILQAILPAFVELAQVPMT